MRIYEGSPRQDFEEVLRAVGAFLDQRGMRDVLLLEIPDGFIVQGLVAASGPTSWSDTMGTVSKETLTFLDEDIGRFLDESVARRGADPTPAGEPPLGTYEAAFRVLGHYLDEQHPRDIFFLEQAGSYVVRLHVGGQAGGGHTLAEFTADDIETLCQQAVLLRHDAATNAGAATPGS